MTIQQKQKLLTELSDLFCCSPSELKNQTVRWCFEEAEKWGATVYWGFWTEESLNEIF